MILPVSERPVSLDAKKSGFTIPEILVVIMVGSLVIGFALSLFLFAAKLVSGWQKKTELTDQVRGVAWAVIQDMDRALRVETVDDSTWKIVLPADRRVTYRASAGAVFRNESRLLGELDIFIRLSITSSSPQISDGVAQGSFTVLAEGTRGGYTERVLAPVSLAKSSKLAFSSRAP